MKVFFASSTSEIEKYFPIYKLICKTIVEYGHELTRDWLDGAREVQKKHLKVNFNKMYEDIISSILDADVGIVEGTVKGLSTGYQMTIALERGKPVLFLHQNTGRDKFPFTVRKEQAPLFVDKTYHHPEETPELIKDFLDLHKKGKRIRFNLVLSPEEEKYLAWASFHYKKTKTGFLKEMIQGRIRNDTKYQSSFRKQKLTG